MGARPSAHPLDPRLLMSFSRFVWPAERLFIHQCKPQSFVYKFCMQHFFLLLLFVLYCGNGPTSFDTISPISEVSCITWWGNMYQVTWLLFLVLRSILTYSIIRLVKYKQQLPHRLHRNSKVTKKAVLGMLFIEMFLVFFAALCYQNIKTLSGRDAEPEPEPEPPEPTHFGRSRSRSRRNGSPRSRSRSRMP